MAPAVDPIESILAAAVEITSDAERRAYVEAACADNTALKRRVQELIDNHFQAGSFLESPAPDLSATLDLPAMERSGTVVGAYKLLEQIGEGGFGVVFLAEQTQPVRRKVALKVLKAGMDTRQVVARFEAERQALAIMDHPNIAKVFDGGATSSGRPYFVMELVKGVPITDYCDQNHLTPRQRLELFFAVCGAVQHAHQKGIIHRDLKPSNVLVSRHDTTPVVKVIDFGVAKALGQELTDKTLFTGVAQMVGTPLYMSPEQAGMRDLDVDTRSDVYSLGVLLYELLTGTTPFDKERFKEAGYDEIRRIIREEDPPRPSTRLCELTETLPSVSAQRQMEPAKLSRLVRGELDWIVMKALEKDRDRRYESANGFAMDVQRYLSDETVQACPPSAGYRFGKFARRNKRALVTAGVVALAVMLAAGIGGWAVWDRAARQATIAAQADQVLAESRRLYQQRKLPEANQIAHNALSMVDGDAGNAELAGRAREWIKDLDMVARLEELHTHYDSPDGNLVSPRGNWAKILDDYPQVFREYGIDVETFDPEETAARIAARPIRVDLATGLDSWDDSFNGKLLEPHTAAAREALRARLRQIARLADPDVLRNRMRDLNAEGAKSPRDDKKIREMAASVNLASTPIATLMLIGNAHGEPREVIAFYTRVQRQHPNDFAVTYNLGRMHGLEHEWDSAIQFLTAAVAIRPQSRMAWQELAYNLLEKGQLDEGIAAYQQADRLAPLGLLEQITIGRALLRQPGREQKAVAAFREAIRLVSDSASGTAVAHERIGSAYGAVGKYDDEIAAYREAIRLMPGGYARANHELGIALEKKGLVDDAIAAHREAVRLSPDYGGYHQELGLALCRKGLLEEGIAAQREAIRLNPTYAPFHNMLGFSLGRAERRDAAIAAFREAVRLMPNDAILHTNVGSELQKKGEFDAAIAAYREAVRLRPDDANFRMWLGIALEKKGLVDEAIAALREAVRLKPDDANFRIWLGTALEKKGLVDEAIAAHREAVRLKPDDANLRMRLGFVLSKKGLLIDAIVAHWEAVRLAPNDAIAHNQLGIILGKKGLVDDAIAAHREAIRLKSDAPTFYYALGVIHARFGQWGPAAAAYARGLEMDPNNPNARYTGLMLQLAAGNEADYRRCCQQMLERFGQTNDPIVAARTAKTCALIPDTVADFKQVENLADRIVTGTEKHPSYRFFVLVKALVEYRAGRHEEAVRWAERCAPVAGRNEFDAFVFATLSMAQHELGNADKARAALASAEMIVTRKMPDPVNGRPFSESWTEWLHADVVLREAKRLVKEK